MLRLILISISALGFQIAMAEDAYVLPQGVLRIISGTSSLSIKKSFDANGNKIDLGSALGSTVETTGDAVNAATANTFPGASWNGLGPRVNMEASLLREDVAFEYGLNNLMSISLRFPIYVNGKVEVTKNSDMTTALTTLNAVGAPTAGTGKVGELFNKLSQNGKMASTMGDTIIGVKYQFMNTGGTPLSHEPGVSRIAGAIGINVPTGTIASPDTNDIATTKDSSAKSWIVGARSYWDYQFTSSFFLNFYTEHEYRLPGNAKYLYVNTSTLDYRVLDMKFRPGFYNHLELDLAVQPELAPKLVSDSGLRLTGDYTATGKYTAAPTGYSQLVGQTKNNSNAYTLSPYAGVLYYGALIPFKIKMAYYIPTSGKNANVTKGYSLIIHAFLKF